MTKKIQLFCLTLFSSLFINAQTGEQQSACGNSAPPQQWENWMGKEVEKWKAAHAASKTQQVGYMIPVVVHIISFGEPEGTFPNIDSSIVRQQIEILNHDFAGTGLNTASTPTAFTGVMAGNTGIQFCRAVSNPAGATLPEAGIDRIDASLFSWDNPATPTVNIQNYINNVVVPSRFWDPTKYFNIYISDRSPTLTVTGFATYPSGTTLTGLYSGVMGQSNNDLVWVYAKAFGTTGVNPTMNMGRTLTHETGHWLGLRHIWGDGNCLSDYCDDTPWAKQKHTGCPAFPIDINRCGVNQSPYGEMTMNHMDMTNDSCRYMFTKDQFLRMQIAMSQCTNRNLLGTHGLCTFTGVATASAIPSFSLYSSPCSGHPFTPYNTSSGYPLPNYIWSSTPPANFSPNPTVANPAITFNTPGTYTLSLVATNTVSNGTYTMAITVGSCTGGPSLCIDSLRRIRVTDSLVTYKTSTSSIVAGCGSGFTGYLTGNNCYQDKEYAQYYAPSSYSNTPYPQVNSVIVLFDTNGTKARHPGLYGSMVSCKIYGGTIGNGPVSALSVKQDSLRAIRRTTTTFNAQYMGNPNQILAYSNILPYKFDFNPPVTINSPNNGFFAAVDVPILSGDSIRIFTNSRYTPTTTAAVTDSSSWALTFNNIWRPLKSYRNAHIQLAMMPQITCSPISNGIEEKLTAFSSNISVMPNPNSGVFNLVFTLKQDEEIYIRVYNGMGQELSAGHLQNVRNNMMSIDLSDKPDGIYFTEITNGTERVVKKIIVNH